MESGPVINGRYRLLDKVGEGGMAEVWRARDTALGRIVALKVLRTQYSSDPAFLARFRREAQAAANLTHPNIIDVFDIGEAGGRHYIVMEYVDGQDLRDLIRQQAPLSVDRALDLATQAAAAVAYAHRAGIVHRDVKPQNILVATNGHVKVTDFGIARAMSDVSVTETGVVLGTAHYLAPEQVAGDPATPASDVYALGVVLYEMLTGRTPFDADSSIGVAMKRLQETPTPVQQLNPHVPASVAAVVNRAMAKDPAQRYEDAGVLTGALRAVREWGEQVTSAQPAVVQRPARPTAPSAPEPGFDTMGVFLGIVALVAVLGLIPLWRTVYDAYARPASRGVPVLPAPTGVVLIEVPNVVGLPQADAEDLLRTAGFEVNVLGSRQDEEIPVSHVVQAKPAPGTRVERNTTVGLIISSGPSAVELPSVLGLSADEAQRVLLDVGFDVQREEAWGGEVPAGTVISQEPPGGVRISRGSGVTILVSTGTVLPLNANLGDQIELVEAELPQRMFQPEDTLQLTLHWRARQAIGQNYVVFVHVTPPDGPILTQRDTVPLDGGFPTLAWTPGELVSDTYRLAIPSSAPAGTYEIRVGMYPFGQPALDQRLPIVDAGGAREILNSLIIAELEIGD
ncbi:MAG: protein kinase [Anaerolineae bacterium]